jgi:AraC-like DNA-binding protein
MEEVLSAKGVQVKNICGKNKQMTGYYPKIYLYKRIVQAKLFIDTHFSDDIDLNNIADEACFSKFHFIRLFKNIYGKTPHQYLTSVRIESSKELSQKDYSVAETCLAVGFDSVSSFTALFKRYTNLCPSEYQQHFKKRRQEIEKEPLQFIPNCFAEHKGWRQKSNFEEAG